MENFDEPRSKNRENPERETQYVQKRFNPDKQTGNKRWLIPLTLLLVIMVAISIFIFIDNRIETGFFQQLRERLDLGEQQVEVNLPLALFSGEEKDIEEITTRALEEQGVDEVAQSDDQALVYKMSPEVRDKLLGKAKTDLEEKITALKDNRQYPYLVDISYDDSYQDFYLVIDHGQKDRALFAAAKLFVLAVYYHTFNAAEDAVQGVSISIEDTETGDIREKLESPDDLNRVAAILESPEEPEKAPKTPQAGSQVIVSTGPDNLNLRDGPEITYLIIDILRSETILDVTGKDGDWLEVITPDGKEGWVHGDYVKIYTDDD